MLQVVTNRKATPRDSQEAILFTFEVKDADGTRTDVQAINAMFAGRPMEQMVRSHWAAYPSLRDAAISLMGMIGNQWRTSPEQVPLLIECIEAATQKAIRVVQEDGATARLVVSAYLAELADAAVRVAEFSTFGLRSGQKIRWPTLTIDLDSWARDGGVTSIQVEEGAALNQSALDGYRSFILSRIATPAEVGLVLRSMF